MLPIVGETPTDVKHNLEVYKAQLPTASVLLLSGPVDRHFSIKTTEVLRRNIEHLLRERNEEQQSLAKHCGHDKSWLTKILKGERGFRLTDLDRIGSFFGLDPYQLFLPGINALTERRKSGADRRAGTERRIGHQGRQLAGLRTELNKLPSIASAHGALNATRPSALPPQVQRILEAADRDVAAFYAGEQVGADRRGGPPVPHRHRKARRSDTETG